MTDIVERLCAMENDMVGPYRTLTLEAAVEIERLQNLILGACNIFSNLDAPHWAAEFRRALEQKP